MTKSANASQLPIDDLERRVRLGEFFRSHRLAVGLSLEAVARDLELDAVDILKEYEDGRRPIPLEDVFALTNLLNVAPEAVMDLVHTLYMHGAH